MKALKAFKSIFPHGDYDLFLHYFRFWHDVDIALWAYGEIRQGEYLYEKSILKEVLKCK